MRRLCMSLLCVALAAWVMPGIVLADYIIQGENADIFQNAEAFAGPGTPSGGQSARLYLAGGEPRCTYYWLDAGEIAPGSYNLTVTLWGENQGRSARAELRTGTHLGDDSNWLNPTGYAVPKSGQEIYESVLCTTTDSSGIPTVFTFVSGTDYTLRLQGYSGDTPYVDYMTFASVPEPATLVLLSVALFGLLAYAWRKRR